MMEKKRIDENHKLQMFLLLRTWRFFLAAYSTVVPLAATVDDFMNFYKPHRANYI